MSDCVLRRKIIRIFFVAVWQFGSLGNHQTAKSRSLGPIKANQKTSKQLAVWQFGKLRRIKLLSKNTVVMIRINDACKSILFFYTKNLFFKKFT
jgi:hypothetical protein